MPAPLPSSSLVHTAPMTPVSCMICTPTPLSPTPFLDPPSMVAAAPLFPSQPRLPSLPPPALPSRPQRRLRRPDANRRRCDYFVYFDLALTEAFFIIFPPIFRSASSWTLPCRLPGLSTCGRPEYLLDLFSSLNVEMSNFKPLMQRHVLTIASLYVKTGKAALAASLALRVLSPTPVSFLSTTLLFDSNFIRLDYSQCL